MERKYYQNQLQPNKSKTASAWKGSPQRAAFMALLSVTMLYNAQAQSIDIDTTYVIRIADTDLIEDATCFESPSTNQKTLDIPRIPFSTTTLGQFSFTWDAAELVEPSNILLNFSLDVIEISQFTSVSLILNDRVGGNVFFESPDRLCDGIISDVGQVSEPLDISRYRLNGINELRTRFNANSNEKILSIDDVVAEVTVTAPFQVVFDPQTITYNADFGSEQFNLDNIFEHPYGDALAYSVESPVNGIVDIAFNQNTLTLTSKTGTQGDDVISITATDSRSNSVTYDLRILVGDPELNLSTTQITFTDPTPGVPARQSLTLSNVGVSLLSIIEVSSSNPAFSVSPSSVEIPAGGTATLEMDYADPLRTAQTGTLTFVTNEPNPSGATVAIIADPACGVLSPVTGEETAPFIRLGMVQNITSDGIYHFDLDGNSFSSYAEIQGDSVWLLLASSLTGNEGVSGSLAESAAITLASENILPLSLYLNNTDIKAVRMSGSSATYSMDLVSNDPTVLLSLRSNEVLNSGVGRTAWTGDGLIFLGEEGSNILAPNNEGSVALPDRIYHTFSYDGLHWTPIQEGRRRIRFSEPGADLRLWIYADPVAIPEPSSEILVKNGVNEIDTFDFGEVELTGTNTVSITLENLGCETRTLALSTSDPVFSLPSTELALASLAESSIDLTFSPAESIAYSENLEIRDQGTNELLTQLTLTGTSPVIPPPVFTSPASDNVDENTEYTYTIAATSTVNLTYRLADPTSNNDNGLVNFDGTDQFVLAAQNFEDPQDFDGDNVYEIEVIADDGQNTATQTVLLAILDVNEPPVFTGIENFDVEPLLIFETSEITFSDPDAAAVDLTFSIDQASQDLGITINPNTGVLTWPNPFFLRVYSVSVTATEDNSDALSTTQQVTIEVSTTTNVFANGSWSGGEPTRIQNLTIQDDLVVQAGEILEGFAISPSIGGGRVPGGSVTIESGGTVISNFNVTGNGLFTIESGGSLVTFGEVLEGQGGFTVLRNTTFDETVGRYSMVGTPVDPTATSGTVTGSSLGTLAYKYDVETGQFIQVTASEELETGVGYFSAFTGTLEFVGTPNWGNIEVPLTYSTEPNNSYNLLANPYPAAIDYDLFRSTNSGIDGTIYLWVDGGSEQGRRTSSDYLTVSGIGAVGPDAAKWNGHIGTAQGFFVLAVYQQPGGLTPPTEVFFNDEMKVTGNNADGNFFRKVNEQAQNIELHLQDAQRRSYALVGYHDEASDTFNPGLDARRPFESDFSLYSLDEEHEHYTIQAWDTNELNDVHEIRLGYSIDVAGQYEFALGAWADRFHSIQLVDHAEELVHDLAMGNYRFYSLKGRNELRFSLRLNRVEDVLSDEMGLRLPIGVYAREGQVTIFNAAAGEADVRIYSLEGRIIYQEKNIQVSTSGTLLQAPLRNQQLYILEIGSDKIKFIHY